MNTFSELPLSSALQQKLAAAQFVTPTPVQAQALPPALEGKDVLATAQTGTGKTLAFLIPIIEMLLREPARQVNALVLLPTRELAMQVHEQYEALRSKTTPKASLVIGGVNEKAQIQGIRVGAGLVIATPGRLQDFISRNLVDLRNVRILVLDEADRMLDMGFLPTVKKIIAATPSDRQTLLFSATIQSSVRHLVQNHVRDAVRVEAGDTSKPIEKIELHLYEVEQDRKLGLLQHMLDRELGSFLVFARTKHGADKLAKKLAREGQKTAAIHGNRSQSQRTQALRGFQDGD